jgi:hypothetical protein
VSCDKTGRTSKRIFDLETPVKSVARPITVISPDAARAGVTGQHLRVVLALGMTLSIASLIAAALLI